VEGRNLTWLYPSCFANLGGSDDQVFACCFNDLGRDRGKTVDFHDAADLSQQVVQQAEFAPPSRMRAERSIWRSKSSSWRREPDTCGTLSGWPTTAQAIG